MKAGEITPTDAYGYTNLRRCCFGSVLRSCNERSAPGVRQSVIARLLDRHEANPPSRIARVGS
jgi:hypothetical protein